MNDQKPEPISDEERRRFLLLLETDPQRDEFINLLISGDLNHEP